MFRPSRRYFPDTIGGFQKVFEGIGVTEPNVILAIFAESAAIEAGDPSFVQQKIGEFFRWNARAAHVGKGVEGAAGERAAKSGNLVQGSTESVAAPPEFSHHAFGGILRAGQRGDAGALR